LAADTMSAAAAAGKEDRLKMLRGAAASRRASTASDLRRRVTDLQSTNDMLLSFLSTLPPAQLDAAPRELRAILPARPHTVLPTMSAGRKHHHYLDASPPADMSPDAPPALSSGVLPSLMQQPQRLLDDSTPQPAAKKQQAAELRRAIDAAESDRASSAGGRDATSSSRRTPAASAATPSSEIKLLSSQKVPQLNMQSLDELRKDLFSPATAAAQGLSGVEPPVPRDGTGVKVDDAGNLLNSTMLSPVVEARAKQSSATPERNLRVVIPKQDGTIEAEEMTPLKQARLRARESEAEAGASLASLATPLKNAGRRTPASSKRKGGDKRSLSSPGGGARAEGGSVAPTPTRQRGPGAAGRRTPDSSARVTPKGGRQTPKSAGAGLLTPSSKSPKGDPQQQPQPQPPPQQPQPSSSDKTQQQQQQQQQLKEQDESLQDAYERFQKTKKGKSAKSRGPTRDCFLSRNGNFKTRPGTLVDSGEEAVRTYI
jgi:hypothetical protein